MTRAPEPRWLPAPVQKVWRDYLRATQEVHENLERDLVAGAGLTLNEYEVMVELSEAPGREKRMSVLAEALVSSRSRLTHTVRRMEQRGLVARVTCPKDGRGVVCRLTDAGFAELESAAPLHVESVRRHIFDHLCAAEIRQFGVILAKLCRPADAARPLPLVEQ